jgi:Tfp pilus assembly protein PilV
VTRRASAYRRLVDHRTDDGISLIEVLVATVLLLVTMIPMGILLTSVSSSAVQTRQRQAAEQLADSWIQVLSNSNPPTSNGTVLANQPTLLTSTTTTDAGVQALSDANGHTFLAGTQYTATADYTENLVNDVGQSDLCSAGTPPSPSHPGVIQLQVTVTWGHNNQNSLSQTTEIDYPKPGVQTQGFLAITVSNEGEADVLGNSALTRLEAIPVWVTQTSTPSGTLNLSPNPYKLYPDLNGCIFAQVPVGTYTISAEQPTSGIPGYTGTPEFVGTNNSPVDQTTKSVTVTAESVVSLGGFDEGIDANLSYGGASAVDSGVACPDAAGLTCVTLGSGTTGASAAWGGTSANWTVATLSNQSHLNQVACTTAASAKCVGVGYLNGAGLIASTTTNFNSTTTDGVPGGVTDITQVTCPSHDGCYALGTAAAGPVLLAGSVGSGTDVWRNVTPASPTFTAFNSLACPTSGTCELSYSTAAGPGVLRLDGDPSTLAPTVTADYLPTATLLLPFPPTAVGTITCPSTTTCLATATGDGASSSDGTVIVATIAGSGASTWGYESTFPTGATSVTGIACSGSHCVAIGSAAPNTQGNTAAVWTGDLTTTPDTWVQSNGIPTNVAVGSAVTCGQPNGSAVADCVVTSETSGASGVGQLLVGSLSGGSWAWNFASPPSGTTVQFYTGVSCESPASASKAACAAVGATANGPIVLTSSSGPSGSWSSQTPTTFGGSTVSGIPLEVAPASTTAWSTQVAAGQPSNATSLPSLLYPQPGGYSVAAGDCSAQSPITTTPAPANAALPSSPTVSSTLNALPGGTASATVPLSLLPLRLTTGSNAPVAGATLTLTSVGCYAYAPPVPQTVPPTYPPVINQDTYNVPTSDATGVTMTSVPYGIYNYSVTIGGTAVTPTNIFLVVGPSTVQIINTNSTPATTTTDYLPNLVQVPA